MNHIFLSLGSNIGNRLMNLDNAVDILSSSGVHAVRLSNVYETSPWGFKASVNFLNQVMEAYTRFSPEKLYRLILKTETTLGRIRTDSAEYVSREIDIDILFFNDEVIENDHLSIPHPRLHERGFVLVPMMDLAPDHIHPVLNRTIKELHDLCPDTEEIALYEDFTI